MSEFKLKPIEFLGKSVSILCQNENGPCPLLAIANVLILRGHIRFHPDIRCCTLDEVMGTVADKVFELNTISSNPNTASQQNQQFQSVIQLIPQLQRGLDVNVKFGDVDKFEFTEEFEVYDAFRINLYHGWVIDPQAPYAEIIQKTSYNQLTTRIAEYQSSMSQQIPTSPEEEDGDDPVLLEGLAMSRFLEETSHQLTFYGLMRLYEIVKEGELGVFFRNDHFSTLYRHENKLYSLVTDLGYELEPHVVWELLDNIDGNTEYVNSSFVSFNQIQQSNMQYETYPANIGDDITNNNGEDMDYMLALQLSQEDHNSLSPTPPPPVHETTPPSPPRPTDKFNFTSTTVKRPSQSSGTGSVKVMDKHIVGRVQPPSGKHRGASEEQRAAAALRSKANAGSDSKSMCIIA